MMNNDETFEIALGSNGWFEITSQVSTFDDWSLLNEREWDSLINYAYLDDKDLDMLLEEFFAAEQPMEKPLLTAENRSPLELFNGESSTEAKLYLDTLDFTEIVDVFDQLSEDQISTFLDGLTIEDKLSLTQSELEASYLMMSPSAFKKTYFDEMSIEEIMQVCSMICESFGSINDYVEGLTVKDWLHMTPEEWHAFFLMADVDYLVEFVHSSHSVEPKIVYHMFKNMPRDMLEDFEHTPELHDEFDQYEIETIRRGVRDNVSRIESVFDIEAEIEAESEPVSKRQGGKKHGGNKNGGNKPGAKKQGQKMREDKKNGEKKHKKNAKKHN